MRIFLLFIFTAKNMKGVLIMDLAACKDVKNFDELPLSLTIEQMGKVLGISRSTAYELANSKGFPTLKIGRRMIIPRIALMRWMMTKDG